MNKFTENEIDGQASLEFIFVTEAAKESLRRSVADYSRADSYENFDKEDEGYFYQIYISMSLTLLFYPI